MNNRRGAGPRSNTNPKRNRVQLYFNDATMAALQRARAKLGVSATFNDLFHNLLREHTNYLVEDNDPWDLAADLRA